MTEDHDPESRELRKEINDAYLGMRKKQPGEAANPSHSRLARYAFGIAIGLVVLRLVWHFVQR
jgi:hypothetical protein